MKYRSTSDIFASILESATEKGARLITFTSYIQIKHFLKLLIDHGLLEYDDNQRFYRTTKKGLQYLDLYRQMEELVRIQ